MKAFIFCRHGNAIATNRITVIAPEYDALDHDRQSVRIYSDDGCGGQAFDAAQDTVEGVVAAIRQAEIEAAAADEYRRCEARYDFERGRPAQ